MLSSILSMFLSPAFAADLNQQTRAQLAGHDQVIIEVNSPGSFEYRLCKGPLPSKDTFDGGSCPRIGAVLPNTAAAREALSVSFAMNLGRNLEDFYLRDRPFKSLVGHLMIPPYGLALQYMITTPLTWSSSAAVRTVARVVRSTPGFILSGLGWASFGHWLYTTGQRRIDRRMHQHLAQIEDIANVMTGLKPAGFVFQEDQMGLDAIVEALASATEKVASVRSY